MNPNIKTYFGVSKGRKIFYEKFRFMAHPNENLGSDVILYNK